MINIIFNNIKNKTYKKLLNVIKGGFKMFRYIMRFRIIEKKGRKTLPRDWPEFVQACEENEIVAKKWMLPVPSCHFRYKGDLSVFVSDELGEEDAVSRGFYEVFYAYSLERNQPFMDAAEVAREMLERAELWRDEIDEGT
jgi:hypothetical protein